MSERESGNIYLAIIKSVAIGLFVGLSFFSLSLNYHTFFSQNTICTVYFEQLYGHNGTSELTVRAYELENYIPTLVHGYGFKRKYVIDSPVSEVECSFKPMKTRDIHDFEGAVRKNEQAYYMQNQIEGFDARLLNNLG